MPLGQPLVAGLFVLALLAAACGSRPKMVPPGETGVGRLRFVGVESVDEDELLDGLGLVHARELGQPFARFLVALDRRRIRSYYVRRGFFGVTVETAVDRVDNRADVTFTVVEGERARLGTVLFLELPDDPRIDATALRRVIPMRDGDPFDYETWELAKPRLTEALQRLGYAWAQVDGVVLADAERAEAVIRVTVEAGPSAVFGKVAITGVPEGLEGAVNARVTIEPGAPFDPRAIEKTRAQLYEMGRFSLVRVEPDRTVRGKRVVDVAINVGEAPRHELRLGGGVGADPVSWEGRLRALYGVQAWPTPLTSSRAELRPALVYLRDEGKFAPRLDAIATLDRLDLVRPRYMGTLEGSFTYLAVEAFTSYGPRIRFSVRSPTYLDRIQASAGWQLGLIGYRDVSAVIENDPGLQTRLGIDRADRLGAYDQSLVVDLRDSRAAPRNGAYLEVRAEEGTAAAGGELDYVRLTPEARGYFGLGPWVLAGRARAGRLFGDVPATRRFFAGGANSQRGFPERHLAPFVRGVDDDGETRNVPFGGAALLELSAEVRFNLPDYWYFGRFAAAAFVDGADVTETWNGLDAGNLHWAAGGGLRLPTPVGAVRFDVGYRLNRRGPTDPRPGDRFAYHLSVGEAF